MRSGHLKLFSAGNAGLGEPVAANNHLAVLPHPFSPHAVAVLAGFTDGFPGGLIGHSGDPQTTRPQRKLQRYAGCKTECGQGAVCERQLRDRLRGKGDVHTAPSVAGTQLARFGDHLEPLACGESQRLQPTALEGQLRQRVRLTGAQASGEKVTVDVGRNLALESQQDSDRYDAKQQNASAGGSFTFGSMTGSVNVSASKDKLHSNFDSVKEQTGLFAGQGGYDVKVKKHTQLDGAVIASQADKEKNRLDTGTLGWTDIHNQADYSATHSGGSFSTGGPVDKDLLTNMAGGMLSGANHSGHAEGRG